MKNFSAVLVNGFALLIFACSHTMPGGLIDATAPVSQKGYEVLGQSEGSVSSTFVFGIQTNKPDMEEAISEAVAKLDGDELANVTWEHKSANYFLFSKYMFTVSGTVIRRTEGGSPISPSIKPLPPSGMGGTSIHLFNGVAGQAPFLAYSSGFDANGFRIGWRLWRRDTPFFAYPEISFGGLGRETKFTTFRNEVVTDNFTVTTIPLTFNLGLNVSELPDLRATLGDFNPFFCVGAGYYLTRQKYSTKRSDSGSFSDSEWKYDRVGLNAGFGLEYFLQNTSNLALTFSLKRHFILTETRLHYWDWQLGLTFY